VASGYTTSAVASGTYTIQVPAATPALSPGGGTFTSSVAVTLTDSTPSATIYYTTNGSTPTTSSTPYTGPITVATTQTIKAIAAAAGYTTSAVASATYTIQVPAATPALSPGGGTFTSSVVVTITDSTPGSTIYYTTNGSTPTTASPQYTGPITVTTTQTLKAMATASGYAPSAVASATYTIQVGVSAPILRWQYGGCSAGPYCQTGWYSSPAVADLDGDGRPDVIWGAYDVVALNGADGSLKWRGASGDRVWSGVAVADLTGVGTLEVVVARRTQLTVYDRFGGVVWTRNPFGVGELRTLAVADLETDGQLEIIVGTTTGTTFQLNVFEPNGTVRPGWPARHSGDPGYGSGMYNQNVAVADMNGDGLKEVFAPMDGHYINAFNRGGNQLATNSLFDSISPAGPKVWSQVGIHVDQAVDLRGYANCGVEHRPDFGDSAPVIADVDGDGVPELIVVGNIYNCGTSPYTSLYHVPFILKLDRTRWSGSGFDWTVLPAPAPGSGPRSEDYNVIETVVPNAAVADLDGDGRKEIIYPSYDGKVHAYWLDKTEHGNWPYTIPTSGAPGDDFRFASEVLVADLNNDGRAEVIFTSWPKKATGGVGQLHILDYLGRELYRIDLPAPAIGQAWNGALAAPTLARVDGSGNLAVVVGTVASGVVVYDLPNTANARILWGTGRGNYRRSGTAEVAP